MTAVHADADDRKAGMTLGEIARWVEHARLLGLGDDTVVRATTGMRSQVTELSTRSPRTPQ